MVAKHREDLMDFVAMLEEHGPAKTARLLGISERSVYARRIRAETVLGKPISVLDTRNNTRAVVADHPGRLDITIDSGIILIGSDSHYWPGAPTAGHRAFVKFCEKLQPKYVIKNGDELDGATISRHPPIGWEKRPSLVDEIDTVKERLTEIERAVPNAKRYWPLGNHDARFETRLATVAPEYAKLHGVHLKDHFPYWHPCWMVVINEEVVVKHRFKGGIHATHNNALWSGKTIFTGHLHSLKVTPFSDYGGTRFGVDCGTLADPYSEPFAHYTELNPVNWRSGFVVLTFRDSRLMWPEVVHVLDKNHVDFRGELIEV